MQPSDFINIYEDVAQVIALAVFAFAAFRAITIGRALVNRVYKSRAYFVGALAISGLIGILFPPSSLYFVLLFIVFILVDSAILVALDTDFFHRNTLRWKQIRLAVYALFVAVLIYTLSPDNVVNSLPGIVFDLVVASFLFIFVYTAGAAVVSARRTSDKPLKRFVALAGLLILGYLVNTLLFVFVSELFTPVLLIIFAYIIYLMAMSLSPVGKVEKEIKG